MEVVRNVTHVVVDPELPDTHGGDFTQLGVHVTQVVLRRCGAVEAPHHHRGLTDLALGDPADLVLVKPGRDPLRPTEVAGVDADESGGLRGRGLRSVHQAALGSPACCQASTPPFSALTLRKPMASNLAA